MYQTRLAALRTRFDGRVITPDDNRYEAARGVFNAAIDRRPAAVVLPLTTGEVQAAVRFAADHNLVVAVRGGGHSLAGFGTCDGGLVIDLSAMRHVEIHPDTRLAHVAGGVTWAELDSQTSAFDFAVTGSQVSHIGVGGHTLGGGMGWLDSQFGLTCDNLISAEIVTADGRCVTANEQNNPDLLWALRGGGGNFGVVTSFTFRLHAINQAVLGGTMIFPVERAKEIIPYTRDFLLGAPRTLRLQLMFASAPHVPNLSTAVAGSKRFIISVCYSGRLEYGERILQPLREFGRPEYDLVAPLSYVELQRSHDSIAETRMGHYWTVGHVRELSDDLIHATVEAGSRLPTAQSILFLIPWGGAITDTDYTSAIPNRGSGWLIHPAAIWTHPSDAERVRRWARGIRSMARAFGARGGYLNSESESSLERTRSSYDRHRLRQLSLIKATWDPTNLFRINHNIIPAAARLGSQHKNAQ